jgi:hypothetical protein
MSLIDFLWVLSFEYVQNFVTKPEWNLMAVDYFGDTLKSWKYVVRTRLNLDWAFVAAGMNRRAS